MAAHPAAMPAASPLIVIFGAAIRPDGEPSAALLRRIGYGLEAAQRHPDAPILCSGGAPRPGPTEASIMARILRREGVAPERLILDEASLNTLDNVAAAVRCVREGDHAEVIACSDAYHLPRIRMKLALHGVKCRPGPVSWGPARGGVLHWLGMSLREGVAISYYLLVLLVPAGRRRP